MKRTPLEKYFPKKISKSLELKLSIHCIEQLLSITNNTENCYDIAKMVGMDPEKFLSILNKVKRSVEPIPKRSRRKYPLGVLSDQIVVM